MKNLLYSLASDFPPFVYLPNPPQEIVRYREVGTIKKGLFIKFLSVQNSIFNPKYSSLPTKTLPIFFEYLFFVVRIELWRVRKWGHKLIRLLKVQKGREWIYMDASRARLQSALGSRSLGQYPQPYFNSSTTFFKKKLGKEKKVERKLTKTDKENIL
jgi:hypothetical protein